MIAFCAAGQVDCLGWEVHAVGVCGVDCDEELPRRGLLLRGVGRVGEHQVKYVSLHQFCLPSVHRGSRGGIVRPPSSSSASLSLSLYLFRSLLLLLLLLFFFF